MSEQEFRSLYDATARPIFAYLVGVTGRRDVADDCAPGDLLSFSCKAATADEQGRDAKISLSHCDEFAERQVAQGRR